MGSAWLIGLLAYWLAESFDFMKPLRNVCTVYNIYLGIRTLLRIRTPYKYIRVLKYLTNV